MSGRVTPAAMLYGYDFDLPLTDALDDPELAPERRALAALAIGTALDGGHTAAAELAEAVRQLAANREAGVPDGIGEGARAVRRILREPGSDYPRALWYAVSRCSPRVAAEHLAWLAELMLARGAMVHVLLASGAFLPLLPGAIDDGSGSAQLAID